MYQTGPLADSKLCRDTCSPHFTAIPVEKVTVAEEKDEYLCTFYDEDDCRFQFTYSDIDNKLEVHAEKELTCLPKVYTLGIILGVIGGVVLLGLATLLLWKMFTTIHDRREYAKFQKDQQNAKWDTGENPIYKQATSTFKNPTYGGQ